MSIDWFTAAAQIINLFILIWLLKKFLYHPVLRAMNRRQEKITQSLIKAKEEREAAEEEKRRYQSLQDKAEQEARGKLEQAWRDALDLRNRLMDEAKEEKEHARRKWQKELEQEKERFLSRTTRTIAEEFGKLSETAFRDLVDRHFAEEMIARFLEKTGEEPDKHILASLGKGDNERMTVFSSHELDGSRQKGIRSHLQEVCGQGITVDFTTAPELLAGIVVEVEGRKVGWHLSRYLEDFQDRLEEGLDKVIS